MKFRTTLGLATALAATVMLLAPAVLQGQKGKKPTSPTPIPLEALFQDTGLEAILGDGASYRNGGVNIVEIDGDGGLKFWVEAQAGRQLNIDFSRQTRPGDSGHQAPPPDDPVVDWRFFTFISGSAEPRLNFRTMMPGDVAPARLFFWITTASGRFFVLRADANTPNPGSTVGGAVQVTAVGGPEAGVVETWIVEPLPLSDDLFQLFEVVRVKGHSVYYDAGDYQLPFLVQFKRLDAPQH